MKIEDDLKMHSHYIEELYENGNKIDKVVEMIRARVHEMKETQGTHSYALETLSGDVLKVFEIHKDSVKMYYQTRELIDKMNTETWRRIQPIEFIREILGSPKSYMLLVGFFITLTVTIEIVITSFSVLKHLFPILR